MITIKKTFEQYLDADTAEHLVEPGAYINGENIRLGTSDESGVGYIENILSNAPINHTLPAGTNICIGTAKDPVNGYLVKFNWNSNGNHGIYLLQLSTEQWFTILLNADLTGGLNFDKYCLINGAYIVGGKLLYFNDGKNEPRRLNLWPLIDSYGVSPVAPDYSISLPIDASEITLIRKPVAFPPVIKKSFNATFNNNFIRNESFSFAYEVIYQDGEVAVLSTWSKASLLNKETENYNYIRVTVDPREQIPQSVRLVRLIKKDGLTGKGVVVKTWDRKIEAENLQIENLDIAFDFYNNVTGEYVDEAQMIKPFDSIPEVAGTMTIARNRTILADLTIGKNTPGSSSLGLSLPAPFTPGFTSLNKPLYAVKHRNGRSQPETYAYTGWYVYISETSQTNSPAGYYLINGTDQLTEISGSYLDVPLPPAPTSTAFITGLTFKGIDINAVIASTRPSDTNRSDNNTELTSNICVITGITASTFNIFLPQSIYKAGVVFYDEYLRKCGVVYIDDRISMPARNYNFSNAYSSIEWSLSNANAVEEIPEWATYYTVVRTKNLRTRFFVSGYSGNTSRYASKDEQGLYEFTDTSFNSNTVAIAVDAKALLQANLGWSFNDGDQCILIDNSDVRHELPIIGQNENYILLAPKNIGDLSAKSFVFELYTPHKTGDQEPFFELGELYTITGARTIGRLYSTLNGSFRADSVLISRSYSSATYLGQAMCPNDVYYKRWDTDCGRPNYITKLGKVRRSSGICFSNTYIPGTLTNGLSSFDVLNSENLTMEFGPIRKLILTSRVQQEGSVLLSICERSTLSIYLEETQIADSAGHNFLAKSSKFIGQVNTLIGSYGTRNPESVCEHNGQVFWIDTTKGAIIRYSPNGLFPISDYKFTKPVYHFSRDFKSRSIEEFEIFGSRPFIFGGIDPYHNEYLLSIPKTLTDPPGGFLEDYTPPLEYPYDVYDGKSKVWIYKIGVDRWAAPHLYETEMFEWLGSKLFSMKQGITYKHNVTGSFNSFYGVQGQSSIMFLLNDSPSDVKCFLNLSCHANRIPDFVHVRTETPNIQSSDILGSDFVNREGIYYASVFKDRLSPNIIGSPEHKLKCGDLMRGNWAKFLFRVESNGPFKLRSIYLGLKL